MNTQKIIESTLAKKRRYKKFTTTIDEDILKDLKISAIESGISTSTMIELMYMFFHNIGDEIIEEMLEYAEKENIKLTDIIVDLWKQKRN